MEKVEKKEEIKSIESKAKEVERNKQEENKQKTSKEKVKSQVSENVEENKSKSAQELIKEAQEIVNAAELESKKKNCKDVKNNSIRRSSLIILIIAIIIILVMIIVSTIFGLINNKSNKIINGVCVNNINVSNMTKEDAINKLENELNNNENNFIIVKHNDYSKEIYLSDINAKFNVEESVDNAYKVGRDNNLIQNNYETLYTMISNKNISITFTYDEELLQNEIDKISLELPDLAIGSSYLIDGNNLIIKNSKDGVQIQKVNFTQDVVNAFLGKEKSFEIPVERCERKEVDIEEIHNEIYKKPINAYFTTNPYTIHKEENGLDFAISLDEAKKMLSEDKEEYVIALKTLVPEVTVSKLNSSAFPDLLSTFTTTYGTGDKNRNANIALAAKSINSVVVMPGEVFSYNDLIGECSTRTGYKESTIYLNGELSKGIGGGICQVSTTLYNTVLRANLEIVERRNHSLGVTYVPAGQDAMVSIGTQDFKFKNNRDYPIKVVATTGTGSITCQIYGLKQDTEYEVKLYSRTISQTDTKYKVETYKILYLNGKEVSRTWLSTDTYKKH